jgi:hypothetical protein
LIPGTFNDDYLAYRCCPVHCRDRAARKLSEWNIGGSIRNFTDARSVKKTTSAAGFWPIASKGGIQ